jgi:Phospholipase_D-nuclease N-terminal
MATYGDLSDFTCGHPAYRMGKTHEEIDGGRTMTSLVLLLIPVIILELALMVIALVDVVRRERVRGGNKVIWIVVILIGPIAYLLFGREEGAIDRDQD